MNLTMLKAACAAFHQKQPEDLVEGFVDLFLVAANNARKSAEKKHDFEYSRCTATLSIDGVNGGDLNDAVIAPAGFTGVRQILAVSTQRTNGVFVPVPFVSANVAIEHDRTEIELAKDYWPVERYPSDASFLYMVGEANIVQRGHMIYRFPRVSTVTPDQINPLPLYLECYGWLRDYVEADLQKNDTDPAPDFLVDNGFDYLQWTIIIELNYKFHTFVPRQEGNVGSPERLQQQAWQDLTSWDTYLIDPNSTRTRS